MSDTDLLSPSASPNKASNSTSGVRRVNNMPLVFVGAAVLLFLGATAAVAIKRSENQQRTEQAEEKGGDSLQSAQDIIGDNKGGLVPPQKPELPLPVEHYVGAGAPLPEGVGPGMPSAVVDEAAEALKRAKLARLEEAVRAKTKVESPALRGDGQGAFAATVPRTREEAAARIDAATNDPTATYLARLAQIKGSGLVPGSVDSPAASGGLNSAGMRKVSDVSQFDGTPDRWQLNTAVQAPKSKYQLRAGFVIPAVLKFGINSELSGQVEGQVTQDVFDTATGKYLLIPQGSSLTGAYSGDIAYGQSRLLVAWQRIIFPDGKALDIGAMPGADGSGSSGLNDQVDNHYIRIFGSALLMTGVVAGTALSQKPEQSQNGNSRPSAASALSEALGQQLGTVTAQMISKNLNISPTLVIRPGFRFNVIVTKDLTFGKPYASFDY
jgi:type IV secretory pathway VirB10-like protein